MAPKCSSLGLFHGFIRKAGKYMNQPVFTRLFWHFGARNLQKKTGKIAPSAKFTRKSGTKVYRLSQYKRVKTSLCSFLPASHLPTQ
jgi:hypothetical protein